MFGVVLGAGPIMLSVMFLYAWFQSAEEGGSICSADPVNAPSSLCLQDILDWEESADPEVLRAGRQQMAIVALGVFVAHIYSTLVMPNWNEDDIKTGALCFSLLRSITQYM